jgi:hypothetical protein
MEFRVWYRDRRQGRSGSIFAASLVRYAFGGPPSTGVVPGASLHPGATVSDRFVNAYGTFTNHNSDSVLGITTPLAVSRESHELAALRLAAT